MQYCAFFSLIKWILKEMIFEKFSEIFDQISKSIRQGSLIESTEIVQLFQMVSF